jgi:mycothiol system anti-sigma-R factor
MNCGTPHSVPCTQVLDALFAFLDGEPTAVDGHLIHEHLDECPPCRDEHVLGELMKALVARSCATSPAPDRVRARVIAQITRIEVQISRVPRTFT